jgi:hypothetical protein
MTAEDVLNGARGKPVPFEFYGFTYLLRPISRAELMAWHKWHGAQGERPDLGWESQAKIVALAVCDEGGKALLTEEQVASLPNAAIDAIADEVARRNWGASAAGKAEAPVTTTA